MATLRMGLGNSKSIADPAGTPTVVNNAPEYDITWSTAIDNAAEVGDLWEDTGGPGNFYLVMAISADRKTITVRDKIGSPGGLPNVTNSNGFSRPFTAWSSVSVAVATWCAAGDTLIVEVHSEGSQPMPMAPATFTATALGATGTFKLQAAAGEGHNGIPGTGARIQQSAAGAMLALSTTDASCPSWYVADFEFLGVSAGATFTSGLGLYKRGAASQSHVVERMIARNYTKNGTGGIGAVFDIGGPNARPVAVRNCLIYNIVNSYGSGTCNGIFNGTNGTQTTILNCTLHTAASTAVTGIAAGGTGNPTVKNTAALGFATCYTGTFNTACTHNASSDATAPDNSGGNPSYENLTASNEFVNPGTDFNLKRTSTLVNAGTSVGLTTDIRGKVLNRAPDVGAYENTALEDGASLVSFGSEIVGEEALLCPAM